MQCDYVSTKEIATKLGVTERRVQQLCKSGIIKGATCIDRKHIWKIPKNYNRIEYSLHYFKKNSYYSKVKLNKTIYTFREIENAYVSPYSIFMIENYESIISTDGYLCDFGAGTGILGIVAYNVGKCNELILVEKDNNSLLLSKENCQCNACNAKIYSETDWRNIKTNNIDVILCNPASLPNSIVQGNSFCFGGELGMDMILDSVEFANKKLTPSGRLYIIITSILPRSIFFKNVRESGMNYKLISKKQIAFRPHYCEIMNWVNDLKNTYPEAYYIKKGDIFYEELLLFEVYREKEEDIK